jgi:hypothetical protein
MYKQLSYQLFAKDRSMKHISVSIAMTLCSFSAAYGVTFPEYGSSFHQPVPVADEFMASYNFEGIVALNNCSGSIVRFDDSEGSDQAMVLTNGHCVKLISPGVVMKNQAANRTFTVLSPTASKLGTVRATKLIYATMTKTDAALYLLQETYDEIDQKYNTEPLTLSRTKPAVGMDVEVISGYWKRGYSCSFESTVYQLKEDNWLMEGSMRYSRPGCEIIGGTSGSPVLEAGTRTVVAVNNTTNESGQKCTMNNPCEVDANGKISYQKGYGYAQQTYWFYSCRNEQGVIDTNVKGCLLPQ